MTIYPVGVTGKMLILLTMAQRKPYNPNTKYGRRKLREQAQQYHKTLPQEQEQSFDNTQTFNNPQPFDNTKPVVIILIIVSALLIFLTMINMIDFLKWATR